MDDKGLVQFVEGEIQGVVFKLLQVYWDTRGGVTELFRADELSPECHPEMATASWTEPGVVRGPHEHTDQSNFLVFIGAQPFEVILWDNRPDSPTYRHMLRRILSGNEPMSVLVPPRVVHTFLNLGQATGLSLNFPNRLFEGHQRRGMDNVVRHEHDANSPFRV